MSSIYPIWITVPIPINTGWTANGPITIVPAPQFTGIDLAVEPEKKNKSD